MVGLDAPELPARPPVHAQHVLAAATHHVLFADAEILPRRSEILRDLELPCFLARSWVKYPATRTAGYVDRIYGLLFDAMALANVSVHPEDETGVGNLDFAFEGSVRGRGPRRIAAEFKHAHSRDIVRGITTQLPAYMSACGAEYGAYCVLWFRGEWWSEPKDYETPDELVRALCNALSSTPYADRIRPFVIDCTPRKPASRR